MVGKVFISGLIGSIEDEKGLELIDVIQQVKSQPDSTSYDVYFTETPGGRVDVGDDIYNYLYSLNQTKPVTTIAKGLCASISTKIFMAGGRRVIYEDCEFMIHLPMLSANYLNSNELEEATEEMKQLDKEMVDFYSKTTGTEKEAIYPLMRNETYLTADEAVLLGFATEKRQALQAVAYINNTKTKTEMADFTLNQEDKSWLEKQFDKISKMFPSKKVNLILQDENGVEINFPDLEDTATPSVGDMATVDGVPAEGSYIMPSLGNITAVFVAGELTEIIEPSEDDSEEMTELKIENERLKSELEAANKSNKEMEGKFSTLETQFLNFKTETVSKFELDTVTKKPTEKEFVKASHAKTALQKLRDKRSKK